MKRRDFLGAAALASTVGCAGVSTSTSTVMSTSTSTSTSTPAPTSGPARARVVVVGGGFGGATAAKYIRMWSEGRIDVTLIEPNASFISCPLSNLVLGGSRQLADLTLGYDGLTARGVRIVRDRVASIDASRRRVTLAGGQQLPYDRLVLSPGVDFIWDQLPGMQAAGAQDRVLHAWKAGAQTLALRAQLEAMPDGGVFAMTIPPAPYRCPPGPYERACQVAHYFSRAKPRSKVLILDANEDVVSKGALFKRVWAERFPGMVEYRPSFRVMDIDATSTTGVASAAGTTSATVISEFGERVPAAVLNVIPPQRAGAIAVQAGLANANGRWCTVDFRTFESTVQPFIHVLGDAIQVAPLMPKSGHMANQHAKVCAAAVVDLLAGAAPNEKPMLTNTCYSFVSDTDVIHVASVHAWDADKKTLIVVPGSGGLSAAPTALEGVYANSWARNIWADTLA